MWFFFLKELNFSEDAPELKGFLFFIQQVKGFQCQLRHGTDVIAWYRVYLVRLSNKNNLLCMKRKVEIYFTLFGHFVGLLGETEGENLQWVICKAKCTFVPHCDIHDYNY